MDRVRFKQGILCGAMIGFVVAVFMINKSNISATEMENGFNGVPIIGQLLLGVYSGYVFSLLAGLFAGMRELEKELSYGLALGELIMTCFFFAMVFKSDAVFFIVGNLLTIFLVEVGYFAGVKLSKLY